MRLSAVLAQWPKIRPNGYIWDGKHRMVNRMLEPNRNRLMKKVEVEKSNMFYLLHPAVSFEAEDAFHKHMSKIQPSEMDVKHQLEKAKLENTKYAPIPMSDHYDIVENLANSFEKDPAI